jgi:hypothetical protein
MNELVLKESKFLPATLTPGILYVSHEFEVAGHLCPCGCGEKVITPLGDIGWQFYKTDGKPSLFPSLGNWELPCRSHYWIIRGKVEWSGLWTTEQIPMGRDAETKGLEQYFSKRDRKRNKKTFKKIFLDFLNIFS